MTITEASRSVRTSRRVAATILVWLLLLPGLAWALVRYFGVERGVAVQLVAFTPYVTLWSFLPAAVALLARKWAAAFLAGLAVVILGGCVVPRALADYDRGPAKGVTLQVMTSNLFVGAADPAAIVQLVRDNDIAVLAVQEYTPRVRAGFSAAGLDTLLPYAALADEVGTTGGGLYSRFSLSDTVIERSAGGNMQVHATIQPPGAGAVVVASTHPLAPYAVSALDWWNDDLAAEPSTGPDGTPRILLGDFNSTLDHAALRRVISRGYRDAADTVGQGLIGTWGPYHGQSIPPVTLDHVLVDKRIGVHEVRVRRVTGSDHRSVIATLTLPKA